MPNVSQLSIQRKELFPSKVLKKFLLDKTNNVFLVPSIRTIILPSFCLEDKKSGINYILNSMLLSHDTGLDGIVIGFRNIKEVKSKERRRIRPNYRRLDIIISGEYFVFRPKRGSVFQGIVKKKTESCVCCMIQRYFKVCISKPDVLPLDSWICKNLKVRDRVVIQIIEFDFTAPIPILQGTLVGLPMPTNPCLKSHGDNESDKSKEDDESSGSDSDSESEENSEGVVEENEEGTSFARQLETDRDTGVICSDDELPEEDWADLMNVDGISSDEELLDFRQVRELLYGPIYPPFARDDDSSSIDDEFSEAIKEKQITPEEVMRYRCMMYNCMHRDNPSMQIKVFSSSEESEEESQDKAVQKAMRKEVTSRVGRSSAKKESRIESTDTSLDENEEEDEEETSADEGMSPKQVSKPNDK